MRNGGVCRVAGRRIGLLHEPRDPLMACHTLTSRDLDLKFTSPEVGYKQGRDERQVEVSGSRHQVSAPRNLSMKTRQPGHEFSVGAAPPPSPGSRRTGIVNVNVEP